MTDERVAALFAHLGANPDAMVLLKHKIRGVEDADLRHVARHVDLIDENWLDWEPEPRKPRTWRCRMVVGRNGFLVSTHILEPRPDWLKDAVCDAVLTEVIK